MVVSLIASGSIGNTSGEGAWVLPGLSSPVVTSDTSGTVVNTAQASSLDQVIKAVSQVNDSFSQRGLAVFASISIDKVTGMSVVKFTDSATNEVIGQYPSQAIVAIAESFAQQQDSKGQLLHVSA